MHYRLIGTILYFALGARYARAIYLFYRQDKDPGKWVAVVMVFFFWPVCDLAYLGQRLMSHLRRNA